MKLKLWIILTWREFTVNWKNKRFMRKEKRALKRIKEYADFLSERNNGKVFVVTKDYLGNFVAFDRSEFLIRRARGQFGKNKDISWTDLKNSCVYHTDQKVRP